MADEPRKERYNWTVDYSVILARHLPSAPPMRWRVDVECEACGTSMYASGTCHPGQPIEHRLTCPHCGKPDVARATFA